MSNTSNGGRLSIAAAVSAVMLAGVITPANAQPLSEVEPTQNIQSPAPAETATPQAEEPTDHDISSAPDEADERSATDTPEPTPTSESNAPEATEPATTAEEAPEINPAETQSPSAESQPENVILHEVFSGDGLPDGWDSLVGEWRVEDGRLLGTSQGGQQARIVFGEHHDHYRFEATLRFDDAVNTARWMALGLDMPPDLSENWQQAALRVASTANNGVEFAQRVNGTWNVTDAVPGPRDAGIGQDVTIAVEVSGNRGAWYFDDELVMETTQLRRTSDGVLGLVVNNATIAVDNVTVTEIEPFPVVNLRAPGETAAIIAHRGDSKVAPENTMAAVTSAVEGGADFFEIDINYTADDEVVAIHDSTVDRTTDGTGAVREMTYDEISELDAGSWLDPSYSHADVPKLEEVFDYMADTGAHVLLEYKDDWTPEQVDLTAELVEEYDVADQIIAQSFDLGTVESLQEELPEVPRMILGAPGEDFEEVADNVDAIGWNPSGNYVADNPDWVQEAHAADLATFVYTINDPEHWEQLTALGVDGIITDHPGQLNGWNQRYEAGDPDSGEIAAIVGHRGNSAVAPENTMPAISSSVLTGAEYFEIDIEYTADDKVVAIHDGTVERTTDGTGSVREMTYDQLSQLDAGSWFAHGHGFTGVGVPTLEDVVAYMADTSAHMLLEYKSHWSPEKVQLTRDIIEEYGVEDQIVAQSFNLDTVSSLHQEMPEVPRMILGAPRDDSEELAAEREAIGWNPSVGQVLDNPGWVDRMHEAGLYTFVYTVNSANQWEQLTDLGVDGIITDYPDHLQGWNARFAQVVEQPKPTFPLQPAEPEPSETPSQDPTETPSVEPTTPTEEPTESPSQEPTDQPGTTSEPTETPTETPTQPNDATTPPADQDTADEGEVVGTLEVEPAQVLPGGEVTITADGFEAGEEVEITLNPTLATVDADGDGTFSATVTIPDDIEPGEYTLGVTGLTSGNWGEVSLTVLTPAADSEMTVPPAPDATSTTGDVRSELATTGASASGLIGVAAALMVLVGTMLVILHRRRTSTLGNESTTTI
ncbi:hypothetical protein GCM10023190_06730 [Enteractinococcus fodinae]|uniref:Glycerophosphoryl diester phosphodiesterase n=1 Tax=Enteractinococcus fodinae TaxID=684663 RepID=A0ABU2AZS8_9MICC|nr:glycerophosphodiester phosphodiesterase family protein [Enteractinococcus fodinae]MDR7346850.1 glycerophosphoryl diester phosphodiesterase [Enteractinococcus fodinae]